MTKGNPKKINCTYNNKYAKEKSEYFSFLIEKNINYQTYEMLNCEILISHILYNVEM